MMLGTKGRYAVMAMVDIAGQEAERPVRLAEIAGRQDIALSYLEQIFNRLRQAGLVKSVRGPGGGYVLARCAGDISIADIVLAADENLKMTRCEKDSGSGCMHDKNRCLTHDLWEGLSHQIYAYLRAVSLEDVLNKQALAKSFISAPLPKTPGTGQAVTEHHSC